MEGLGLTVIVNAVGVPTQVPLDGVTTMVPEIGRAVVFVAVKGLILPVPFNPKPILGFEFAQV